MLAVGAQASMKKGDKEARGKASLGSMAQPDSRKTRLLYDNDNGKAETALEKRSTMIWKMGIKNKRRQLTVHVGIMDR